MAGRFLEANPSTKSSMDPCVSQQVVTRSPVPGPSCLGYPRIGRRCVFVVPLTQPGLLGCLEWFHHNSVLTNACALSETMTSGSPSDANDFLRASIVVADVDVRHE